MRHVTSRRPSRLTLRPRMGGRRTGHELVCFFEAAAGAGVVPKTDLAALRSLLAGAAANAEFFVAVRATLRATRKVSAWQIQAIGVVWYRATVSRYGAVKLR